MLTSLTKLTSTHGKPLIAEGLSVTLEGREILRQVSVTARPGQVTALVGPNGAGKSTLLAALAADYAPSAGSVRVGGRELSEMSVRDLARARAVLTQHLGVTVPFTAREVIDFGRTPWGRTDPQLLQRLIAECDVGHLLERTVDTLSGGERARVHAARVFYQDTPIVLLDEPTAALDLHHAEKILHLMRSQAKAGKAVVVVLHDLSAAAAFADWVVVVAHGQVVTQGPPESTLNAETISAIYGIDVEVLTDSAGNPVVIPRRPELGPGEPDLGAPNIAVGTAHPHGSTTFSRNETPMTTTTASHIDAEATLAQRLKSETAEAHEAAENSDFMSQLLGGHLDRAAAVALTAQLYFVYSALEPAVRNHADSVPGSAVYDPAIERVPALERDLEAMIGSNWREQISPLAATEAYVERLQEVAGEGGANAALAHHYVRYLGDLSGGQVIARMLEQHYGIGAEATNFYDFSAVGKIKPYRDAYRQRISELQLASADEDEVIAEAKEAFRLNRAIFQELA